MDLNCTMLYASGAAYNIEYNIAKNTVTYVDDSVYNSALGWLAPPVPIVGGQKGIDACLVGRNATGIIVAARGTLFDTNGYIQDWLNDFRCEPAEFMYPFFVGGQSLNCHVHSGFYGAISSALPGKPATQANSLYSRVQAAVKALLATAPAATPVYVTGHSKGGGMAPLLAYLLHLNGIQVAQVVTFAGPRAGEADFKALYEPLFPNHLRFENYGDVIPLLWPDQAAADDILQAVSDILGPLKNIPLIGDIVSPLITAIQTEITTMEQWNYEPLGTESFIGPLTNGSQPIINNPPVLEQAMDLLNNLVSQLMAGNSLETTVMLAHTIRPCLGTTPVVGYMSGVCGSVCTTCDDSSVASELPLRHA